MHKKLHETLPRFLTNRQALAKKTWQLLVIGLGALILLSYLGYIQLNNLIPAQIGQQQFVCPIDGQTFTTQAAFNAHYASAHPGQTPAPVGTHAAAQLQWTGINSITKGSLTTPDVEIAKASNGIFSFMNAADQVAANSAPEQSTAFFSDSDELIIHIEDNTNPINGEDFYDQWYYVKLIDQSPVYNINSLSALQVVSASPTYTYRWVGPGVDTGEDVKWTSGTTNYWDIGRIGVIPRCTDIGLHQYFKWGGTTMSSMTDGATEVDTAGEITANVTLTTDTENLIYSFVSNTTSVAFGVPIYTVSSLGELQLRPTVVIFSTGMTAISTDYLIANGGGTATEGGWKQMNANTLYAQKAFYIILKPQIPLSGQKFTFDVIIPVDASAAAAGTKYRFQLWANDVQLESAVTVGSPSTSIPTTYGMIAGYGIEAVINDETFTVSSGVGATNTLEGYVTTAA